MNSLNVEDLSKLIVAKGFKKLPRVQNIAQSGHTGFNLVFARAYFHEFHQNHFAAFN